MKLAVAQHYAEKIVAWLLPFCDRIEVAGSIRRERPECADVDVVCIPRHAITVAAVDLFDRETHKVNLVRDAVDAYLAEHGGETWYLGRDGDQAKTPPPEDGKQLIFRMRKCQCDVWFAAPENFGTRLMCRTGSKEHNIWLARRAEQQLLHWDPYEGLMRRRNGAVIASKTEEEIYQALQLPFIEPVHREKELLARHRPRLAIPKP